MNVPWVLFPLAWIEASVLVLVVGAAILAYIRDPQKAATWCLVFSGLSFVFAAGGAVVYLVAGDRHLGEIWSLQHYVLDNHVFAIDDLNAPLLPTLALLHLLTALATPRTKMIRFSFASLLGTGALRMAAFACVSSWTLIVLLLAAAIPPYFELCHRGKSTRVYLLHMGLYAVLLTVGFAMVEHDPAAPHSLGVALLLMAIFVRSGTIPTHCWLTDLFENASFGTALMVAVPISGVYAAIRLVLPIAPAWMLQSLGIVSLATAVYAAGMANIQREARRFFAYLFLSHASLVLVGMELVTSTSLTGSLCLWYSVILGLGGLGLTLRALEARYGQLSLTHYHGLYKHSPSLAVFFLLTGLASVGFPGTLGFISAELLVDGVIEANVIAGLGVVAAAALNGIAVVRAYLLLFTGTEHYASVPLNITVRERIAVLTMTILILGGGMIPQPGITTRYQAAEKILQVRHDRMGARPNMHAELNFESN